jgi:hypothetical protein
MLTVEMPAAVWRVVHEVVRKRLGDFEREIEQGLRGGNKWVLRHCGLMRADLDIAEILGEQAQKQSLAWRAGRKPENE